MTNQKYFMKNSKVIIILIQMKLKMMMRLARKDFVLIVNSHPLDIMGLKVLWYVQSVDSLKIQGSSILIRMMSETLALIILIKYKCNELVFL